MKLELKVIHEKINKLADKVFSLEQTDVYEKINKLADKVFSLEQTVESLEKANEKLEANELNEHIIKTIAIDIADQPLEKHKGPGRNSMAEGWVREIMNKIDEQRRIYGVK